MAFQPSATTSATATCGAPKRASRFGPFWAQQTNPLVSVEPHNVRKIFSSAVNKTTADLSRDDVALAAASASWEPAAVVSSANAFLFERIAQRQRRAALQQTLRAQLDFIDDLHQQRIAGADRRHDRDLDTIMQLEAELDVAERKISRLQAQIDEDVRWQPELASASTRPRSSSTLSSTTSPRPRRP